MDYKTGDLVQVVIKGLTSKIVKCDLAEDEAVNQTVQTTHEAVTNHTLKPGYLVSAKVARLFENGIEISFLGGMTGTVFADHSGKESLSRFKIGEKVKARVISTDVSTKTNTLSLVPHILSLETNS